MALDVVIHFIKTLKDQYGSLPEVKAHLSAMQKDILENLDIFLEESEEQVALAYAALDKKMPRRYQVNVLVSHLQLLLT